MEDGSTNKLLLKQILVNSNSQSSTRSKVHWLIAECPGIDVHLTWFS